MKKLEIFGNICPVKLVFDINVARLRPFLIFERKFQNVVLSVSGAVCFEHEVSFGKIEFIRRTIAVDDITLIFAVQAVFHKNGQRFLVCGQPGEKAGCVMVGVAVLFPVK